MRREQFMCRRMNIYIRYYNEQRWEQCLSFSETHDTGFFLNKFNELYELAPKNLKPIKVSMWFSNFVNEKEHQLSFFENDKRNQVYKAVDSINDKFGRDTIFVGSLQNNIDSAPTRIAFTQIPELDEVD